MGSDSKLFNKTKKNLSDKLTTTQIIVLSFAIIIFIGATLLNMPFASQSGERVGFLNALFTATSCVCVTGLVVVNSALHWTVFGKIVIILLIQIGGLGFMTLITMVSVIIRKKITLKDRMIIQETFNKPDIHGTVKLVINIVIGTFLMEGICAVILSIRFILEPNISFLQGIAFGVFHAISAFCNAGFDILGETSISSYVADPVVNIIIMFLIVAGGIGFAVWFDLVKVVREKDRNKTIKSMFWKLSLHSKIALISTFFLIFGGALLLFLLEFNNSDTLGGLTMGGKIWASLFQSVSPRTAGFYSIDLPKMEESSKFLVIILMAIGGSPAGTAGGIKTVTMSIAIISIISVIRGKDTIQAFRKSISINTLQKSLAVIFMILSIIIISAMILAVTEKNHPEFTSNFMDWLFETTSATATVGLTLGITPYLSSVGKIVIILCMYLGRLGPITVAMALASRAGRGENLLHFPEERVIVG